MRRNVQAAMERLEKINQRATDISSSQPRFGSTGGDDVFGNVFRWWYSKTQDAPPHAPDSRKRDEWLSEFWHQESHLAGVINGVVAIDKNRGWNLLGGRNQVIRYNNILRNAEGGLGWRRFFGMQALSYYTTDMGSITEIGRDGRAGPLRGLYHVDPTLCQLRPDFDKPLAYYPIHGKKQVWERDEFFRSVSLPDVREKMNQLGYCAVSRVLEIAQLMVAVYRHDHEQLGSRAPRGLLVLKNITEEAWDNAMAARDVEMDSQGYQYYGALAVLASVGVEDVDAKLIALSQLPRDFDMRKFVDMLMFGYALAFGYDPSEFWPVQSGALGRGRETEIQHFKATGKGGMDFVLTWQDRLQRELPDTLHFEFEQRDDTGEMLEAQKQREKLKVILDMYNVQPGNEPLITREEGRILAAEEGIIHHEWTETQEAVEISDIEGIRVRRLRDKLLSNEHVIRAMEVFPKDPIVRSFFDPITGRTSLQTLAPNRDWLFRRRSWSTDGWVERPPLALPVQRQNDGEILYEDEDIVISEEDVDRAIENGRARIGEQFAELMSTQPWEDESDPAFVE